MAEIVEHVTERPALFRPAVVRAILDDRKSQTRRIVKPQPPEGAGRIECGRYHPSIIVRGEEEPGPEVFGVYSLDGGFGLPCPYGQPGDRLWVREKFALCDGEPIYWSDNHSDDQMASRKWKPSIHMPRCASRLTLEVTDIRVERVQDISEEDAKAEGVEPLPRYSCLSPWVAGQDGDQRIKTYRTGFVYVWNEIHAKDGFGWAANPLVFVIHFKRRGRWCGGLNDQPIRPDSR